MGKTRTVFHVDMDHFYAAVEERERPGLKGNPIVVGADPKDGRGRGVVMTANYEAREYGIRSGMPISRAWKLCPNATYLRPNFRLYVRVSRGIMKILRRYADKFEQWGLDEAFLEVSSKVSNLEEAKQLAAKIKREVLEEEKLTCSIGVGSNKLVAKIASDFNKPDGLTIVDENDVERFLAPLPVRKLLWVGKKTERKLNKMGVETVGDLAALDVSILNEKFGVIGTYFSQAAHGIDLSEVAQRNGVKSISRETTFEEDTSDIELILETLAELSQEIQEELAGSKLLFRTVTIKVRYEHFETHTHGKTLNFYTNNLQTLQKTAKELIRTYIRKDKKVRLIGVRASNLTSCEKQKTLT